MVVILLPLMVLLVVRLILPQPLLLLLLLLLLDAHLHTNTWSEDGEVGSTTRRIATSGKKCKGKNNKL